MTKEPRSDDSAGYAAVSWVISRPYTENLEARISSNFEAWLALAQSESYAVAAAEVRTERDRRLQESDAAMLLDRMGINLPDNITTTTLLTAVRNFFGALKQSVNGTMAAYRQTLRDIPLSDGFPFDVSWPKKPE